MCEGSAHCRSNPPDIRASTGRRGRPRRGSGSGCCRALVSCSRLRSSPVAPASYPERRQSPPRSRHVEGPHVCDEMRALLCGGLTRVMPVTPCGGSRSRVACSVLPGEWRSLRCCAPPANGRGRVMGGPPPVRDGPGGAFGAERAGAAAWPALLSPTGQHMPIAAAIRADRAGMADPARPPTGATGAMPGLMRSKPRSVTGSRGSAAGCRSAPR